MVLVFDIVLCESLGSSQMDKSNDAWRATPLHKQAFKHAKIFQRPKRVNVSHTSERNSSTQEISESRVTPAKKKIHQRLFEIRWRVYSSNDKHAHL